MKPSQAAQCKNLTLCQSQGRFLGRVAAENGKSCAIMPKELGATNRAGIRLGVKSSVAGILIFRLTVRTHRKDLHRGLLSIIGNGFDNGETRPAIGAVYKRIEKTPIMGIKQFPQAVIAQGDIRGDGGISGSSGSACENLEGSILDLQGNGMLFQGGDA